MMESFFAAEQAREAVERAHGNGWTHAQIADECGVTAETISNIVHRRYIPREETCRKVVEGCEGLEPIACIDCGRIPAAARDGLCSRCRHLRYIERRRDRRKPSDPAPFPPKPLVRMIAEAGYTPASFAEAAGLDASGVERTLTVGWLRPEPSILKRWESVLGQPFTAWETKCMLDAGWLTLRIARTLMGFSRRGLALASGRDRGFLERCETSPEYALDHLDEAARAYGVDAEALRTRLEGEL